MKVSLNTIKQFINFELPPVDELVARINAQLGGVEEVIDLGAKYKDAKIARVVECEKHPNADKLSVCKIDAGAGELVQVVCGATNVHADMWAVWLPPESVVPSTYDDAEPFVLGARELRGIMSHGMLAAGDELAINSDHDGIIEITEKDLSRDQALQTGASFAKTFGLDDIIIDIENKMFTHRPDLFGQLGVAREIAGILGHTFESPEWYQNVPVFETGDGLEFDVFNDAIEKVPRLMFVGMKNVEVAPSPLWLQCALVAMGSKAINNIVDATNYVMLLTAQPTHAYDYDKLRGHTIGARMAKKGEKLPLLNGKTYELNEDDIVIADGEGAIGLGGVMGGGNSEVSAATKNIVLEVATFDMYAVRKSSMRHGLFTDALTRFNKGQSPLQNDRAMSLLIKTIQDVSSAQQASNVYDLKNENLERFIEAQEGANPQTILPKFIRDRLGINMKKYDMVQLLGNVEFPLCEDCGWNPDDTEDNDEDLHVNVPFWRTDIHDPEDVVEEIGRLHGFDKLPRELPMRSTKPAPKNAVRKVKQKIRDSLSRAGANEVLTYSFVHEKVMQKAEQDEKHAFQLSNALSPDLRYYRLSITPSLLDKVHMNIKAGYDQFALFEISKSHYKGEMDEHEPDIPNEDTHVSLVVAANDKAAPKGSAYYLARKYIGEIVDLDSVELKKLVDFDTETDEWGKQLVAMYDPERAAVIVKDNQIWGVVGEFRQAVQKAFKLPRWSAGFEVHIDIVNHTQKSYAPLSKFPSVTQDISLKVAADTNYETVFWTAQKAASQDDDVDIKITPRDIYQAEKSDAKTITLRVRATSHDRTLTDGEVADILQKIGEVASAELGAAVQ